MEPPAGTQQRGPLEQNGGTQLRLQDGTSDGSNDSLSIDSFLNLWTGSRAYIPHIDRRKMFTLKRTVFESSVVHPQFCYKINVQTLLRSVGRS